MCKKDPDKAIAYGAFLKNTNIVTKIQMLRRDLFKLVKTNSLFTLSDAIQLTEVVWSSS